MDREIIKEMARLSREAAQLRERINRSYSVLRDDMTSVAGTIGQASFIVAGLHADLTAERVFTDGWGIQHTDAGANNTFTVAVKQSDLDGRYLTALPDHTHQIAGQGGKIDHGAALNGLSDDDHTQYVHISTTRTITAQHSFAPSVVRAPFTLGANAQGQIVTGLNADQVDGYHLNQDVRSSASPAFAGLTVNGNISVTGTVDGVEVSAHATRHAAAGADPVDHDALTNFVANEHIDHSIVTLTAGNGLTGGGTIAASRTFNVGAGSGITVNADDVAVTWATATPQDVSLVASAIGSGVRVAREDHRHVLNQSITPTWTGTHTFSAATKLQFRDTGLFINSSTDGQLDIDADVEVEITAPTVHLVGATKVRVDGLFEVNGGLQFVGAQSITTTADNLTLAPAGDIILNPTGNDVLPSANYDINLGALNKKYLTLHAAELWVETLVAQNTIATIGGRVVVGPSTTLTSDLSTGDTTIYVKHNQMAVGDRVYLEADGKVEFMAITGGPSGTGPYSYTVTRNLDGTGANTWYGGDTILNTGAAGDGFIDLYSIRGVKSATQYGPTIVGNVRNSATYNDWTEAWAVGNLNGLYGYGTDTYGVGLGKYSAADYVTIDPTNGIRFLDASDVVQAQLSGSVWTLGRVAAGYSNVQITSGAVKLRTNTTDHIKLTTDGDAFFGSDISAAATTAIAIFANAQTYNSEPVGAGDMILGDNSGTKANLFWDVSDGDVSLRRGTSARIKLDASSDTLTVGYSAAQHITVSSSTIVVYDNSAVEQVNIAPTGIWLGYVSGGEYALISSSGVQLYGGGNKQIDITSTGSILVGREAASQNNILIASGAISIRSNITERIGLTAAGILTIKNSGGNAVFTFNASTGAEFTLPLSIATTGGIYQGSGTFASPTTGLKIWNDGGIGRIAGYSSSAIQWFIGTDGKMYVGAGHVRLDVGGLALERGSATYNKIAWTTSSFTTTQATIYNFLTGTTSELVLSCLGGAGEMGGVTIAAGTAGTAGTGSFFYDGGAVLGRSSAQNYVVSIAGGLSTKLTCGLVINQRESDDEILAFQSSDIAHGMTSLAMTNTFGAVVKQVDTTGGLRLIGYSGNVIGLALVGRYTTDDTTKLTSSLGAVSVYAQKKSSTTVGACGSDENLMVIRNYTTTRFIFDAEGSAHADVEWTTFDEHNDVAILDKLERTMLAGYFGGWANDNRAELERLGIAHFDDRPGHAMVNWTRLSMLLTGAIRQLSQRMNSYEQRLAALTG